MSTDIHTLVDVRMDGEWLPAVQPIWPNDPAHPEAGEGRFAETPVLPQAYPLFAALADVRNRSGRMGAVPMKREVGGREVEFIYDMDDGGFQTINFITSPRGIADDVHESWREFASQEGIHTPTWFYAYELERNNPVWDQRLICDGIVTEEDYFTFKETREPPRQIARAAGGDGLRIVDEVEYESGIRGEQATHVRIHYDGGTVLESLPASWGLTMVMMGLLAPEQDLRNVRIHVAFDS